MMGRNIKMAAVAFTAIITLTGCGTKLYDMTDAEQGLIANYSAYVVAKHRRHLIIHLRRIIRHLKPEMIRAAIRRKSLLPHRKRRCHLPRQQATAALKLHMME